MAHSYPSRVLNLFGRSQGCLTCVIEAPGYINQRLPSMRANELVRAVGQFDHTDTARVTALRAPSPACKRSPLPLGHATAFGDAGHHVSDQRGIREFDQLYDFFVLEF